ncbi:MAG TPA: M28 family peptidase [Candidatus Baltobacteraceae bacterium]|nr:M28 family peptidase [Candidatus Baltobacteraceae bacterium]
MTARPFAAALIAASLLLPEVAPAAQPGIVGWAQGPAVAQELRYEHLMMNVPSPSRAMEIESHISLLPHRAGTPADYNTAKFVEARLKADGFQTRVVPYSVWFTHPIEQRLEIVSPKHVAFDLLEGTAPHTKWEKLAGPAFLENSGDGNVTGPVYYINAGSKDDFQKLDDMGVNLRGAVVIVRLGGGGGGARAFDPSFNQYKAMQQRGVAAVLEFMDPATSGYGGGEMWPRGNYKNTHMAERMSGPSPAKGAFQGAPPGDFTLPGQAPIPGVKHLAFSSLPHATIPEMSITQATARALLAGLGGKAVPQDWHPMFEFVQHVGGNERAHVVVKMTRHLTTIWNVFGQIKGSEQPDSIVMIGSHRDAMTFGAIDPGSGTTVMMQDADALHKLMQNGYHPKRTIEIASWDGHELGLWGSASYIFQYGPELRKNVFQYINTDQLTTGNPFVISASPGLWAFIKQTADAVKGPDGLPLSAHDSKERPLLNPTGGGSDHQNFAYILGIPSSSNGYYGAFGAHHTAEDNVDGLRTYDPGMHEAVATAQQTLIQAMRAAGATVSPLRVAEMPAQFVKDLPALEAATMGKVDTSALSAALKAFAASAAATDKAMEAAETSGNTAAMQKLAAQEQSARDAFYVPDGLSFNKYYHTMDRVLAAFPEVTFAGPDPKAQQAAVDRLTAAVKAATVALSQ